MSSSDHLLVVVAVIAAVLAIGQLVPNPASGETVDDVRIEYRPDVVVLPPGDEARLTLTVTNLGTGHQGLAFTFVPSGGARGPEGVLSTVYTTLGPGESRSTELKITSRAEAGDEESVSDFTVVVQWGPDLRLGDDGRVVNGTVDGSWQHDFHVVYELHPGLRYLSLVIVVGLAVLLSALILRPGWAGWRGDG